MKVWIPRYRWESLVQRVERCEKAIRDQRDEMNEKNIDMAKRIFWNSKELSDETKDIKWSKKYIDDFHNS